MALKEKAVRGGRYRSQLLASSYQLGEVGLVIFNLRKKKNSGKGDNHFPKVELA